MYVCIVLINVTGASDSCFATFRTKSKGVPLTSTKVIAHKMVNHTNCQVYCDYRISKRPALAVAGTVAGMQHCKVTMDIPQILGLIAD